MRERRSARLAGVMTALSAAMAAATTAAAAVPGPASASAARPAGPAVTASASGTSDTTSASGSAGTTRAKQTSAPPVSLSITSITPAYAQPGQTVTVSGTVRNTSSAPAAGLTIQLRSAASPFSTRDALQSYADGFEVADTPVPGADTRLARPLRPGGSAGWLARLRVSRVGMTAFGVYPLAAEADARDGTALVTDRTFLPYWPGRHSGYPRSQRMDVAWIWPLIDKPQQTACAGLASNALAASLRGGGRLAGLLAAGRSYATAARLTWAIDPALLGNAQAMTRPYQVGAGATCSRGRHLRASAAAARWLGTLRKVTASQPVFITPYADVDVAGLTRQSLEASLASAFQEGRAVASSVLRRGFTGSGGSGSPFGGQLNHLAWPADGVANYPVLENLAANNITTTVLDSSTMPPASPQEWSYTPSAVTSTPDGVRGVMRILLSDDAITKILGSANSPADSPGRSFAAAQRYLAETAMIAAQAPNLPRAIVVAPPRRWNPPAGLASRVLAETTSAPWLRPTSLGQLAAAGSASGQVARSSPRAVSRDELGGAVLGRLKALNRDVQVLNSIRRHPDPNLSYAVAGAQSSAWRGHGWHARHGQYLVSRLSAYVASQERSLSVIAQPRYTLGGLNGTVPVSISSRLSYPVRVRLKVSLPAGSGVALKSGPGLVNVPAGITITLKLSLRAASTGSTTLGLSLATPGNVPLPGQPVGMTIQATHYGTLALVIIAAALGIFMLTSATRAVRRGRGSPRDPGGSGEGSGQASSDGASPDRASPDRPHQPDAPPDAGNVMADRDHDPEETDEYAWSPGWADGQ